MNKAAILLCFFTLLYCCSLGDHQTLETNVSMAQRGKDIPGDDRVDEYSKTENRTENAQRGKGSYGGANVVHKKPDDKSAASITNLHIALSLLLVLPHVTLIA